MSFIRIIASLFNKSFYFCMLVLITSCDNEEPGPNTNCELLPSYELNYKGADAAEGFNISSNIAIQIKNSTVGYGIFNQSIGPPLYKKATYPYIEYYISNIEFINDTLAQVKFHFDNSIREYKFIKNDSYIDLHSRTSHLKVELSDAGKFLLERRYAIYEYKTMSQNRDTFLFIEFSSAALSSYKDVAQLFASENIGKYDSIAIERITNKSFE
jgi:hypothetical protein